MRIDAVAIYRNSFVGAIALICGWMAARWLFGAFPNAVSGAAIGQGAVIGVSLALAAGLSSSSLPWTSTALLSRAGAFCVVGAIAGVLATVVAIGLFQVSGGLLARTMSWTLLAVVVCISAAVVNRNVGRWPRALLAGVVAGLIGGSTFEAIFLLFLSSDIREDLALTMAGVYGLGLYGALVCGFDRFADDYLRTACLCVESGKDAGRSTTLDTRHRTLALGSARDCELRLTGDGTVAAHHAQVGREGNEYIIEKVDGMTFSGPDGDAPSPADRRVLADGDIICVGIHRIRFEQSQAVH